MQYYNGNVFTWKQGRRLDTVSKNGSVVASYDYDENGIRTSKTTADSSYKYILNGSQIVAETWDDCINIYLYDENGSPIGFLHRYENMAEDTYNTYFYEKNMFGDILAIYDQNGVKQVSYSYDAFGKSTQTIHVDDTRAWVNHLRYRGYYYDKETGFYYLNSRYYDPVTCRFINADGYISTGQGLIGYNMFAYCNNNPVMFSDPTGEFVITLSWKIIEVFMFVVAACIVLNTLAENPPKLPEFPFPKWKSKTETEEKAEEKTKDETLPIPPSSNGATYYHITTSDNAVAIMSTNPNVLIGSEWEGGYVYAWKKKPNKYAIENSGAHMGVTISFKTNASFVADTGITDPKVQMFDPVVSTTPGPIVIWDVQIVG